MDPAGWLGKQLQAASPDLLREIVTAFVAQLMNAEAEVLCGAGYGERRRGPGQLPQRLPGPGVGHPGRHD
jgi:transposase-like protein